MVAVNVTPRKKSNRSLLCGVVVVIAFAVSAMLNSQQPMLSLDFDSVQQRNELLGIGNNSSTRGNADPPHGATESKSFATADTSNASKVVYPLESLNLQSAKAAYERGFWQRTEPVPLDRWQATANTTCIPHSNPILDWKRRVPHVIMIGAQKSGTTALSYYLYNHPAIQYFPSKELHYFDEDLDQNPAILVNGSGIRADKVLEHYQEKVIGEMVPLIKFQMEQKYALDATPNYMWLSDRVPHRILCATPWVKLLAILRDPVDRAYSQYHMQFHRDLSNPDSRRGYVSFEDYISLDMKVLQDVGVLPKGCSGWHSDNGGKEIPSMDPSFLDSDKVMQAWATYTKLGLNSPVGRGLYAFQLRHWFQVMDLYNKPRSDLLVLSSRRLLNSPNETYAEILQFLELPRHSLPSYSKIHATQYRAAKMDPELRVKLQAFYAPFNRQLKALLSTNAWDGIWEDEMNSTM